MAVEQMMIGCVSKVGQIMFGPTQDKSPFFRGFPVLWDILWSH
jgi:hypothetical protein